jgi:uncharacterized OsmC-like protein
MSTLKLTYDGDQHATALREPFQNTVAIDCPITAKGDEFSPGNLLGISVAGCMLLSMGAVAQRDHLELRGTVIDIELTETNDPFPHVDTITMALYSARLFSKGPQEAGKSGWSLPDQTELSGRHDYNCDV